MDEAEYRESLRQMQYVLGKLDQAYSKVFVAEEKMKSALLINGQVYKQSDLSRIRAEVLNMKEKIQHRIIPNIERDLERSESEDEEE